MLNCDVLVIGGGPAGLAAAISAKRNGAKVILLEREARLGGILKQCIHDGFGLVRFGEKLSGPEYAERFIDEFKKEEIEALLLTFVTRIENTDDGFTSTVVNTSGINKIKSKSIILATGCRERTAKQINIHGTRPSGVFTAGTAQHYTNLLGQMPTKKCVILGSGDIGLIMARRLTLEGAKVVGVYEVMPTPSGLTRNIHQCLHDYDIPLYLSHTVTRVYGHERLTAVEISKVDENLKPIKGTQQIVECDSLILSVGLIPENEIAESLGVDIDPRTKGPLCDGQLMTSVSGIFSCGNALHVNDLVDYVSESGEEAGKNAALYCKAANTKYANIKINNNFSYIVPQRLDLTADNSETVIYFRSRKVLDSCVLCLEFDGKEVLRKKYAFLRPPEMERIVFDFSKYDLSESSDITFIIAEETK